MILGRVTSNDANTKIQQGKVSSMAQLCADTEEILLKRFCFRTVCLFLISTNFSALANQYQLSQKSKGFILVFC